MENSWCGITDEDKTSLEFMNCWGLDMERCLVEGPLKAEWGDPCGVEENWNLEAGLTGEADLWWDEEEDCVAMLSFDDCSDGKKVLTDPLDWNVSTGCDSEAVDLTTSTGHNCSSELMLTGSAGTADCATCKCIPDGWDFDLGCTELAGWLVLFSSSPSSISTTSGFQLACFLRSSRFCTLWVFAAEINPRSWVSLGSTAFLFLDTLFFFWDTSGSLLIVSAYLKALWDFDLPLFQALFWSFFFLALHTVECSLNPQAFSSKVLAAGVGVVHQHQAPVLHLWLKD